MAKHYRSKVFKSGNSVALRLPKALGITEGSTMIVHEARGKYIVEPDRGYDRKIDLAGLYGCVKGLERIPVNEVERDWTERPRRNA